MKTITINDIRDWDPCYDPSRYLPKEWSGTAVDILNIKEASLNDRLWVVLYGDSTERNEVYSFAGRRAREALNME